MWDSLGVSGGGEGLLHLTPHTPYCLSHMHHTQAQTCTHMRAHSHMHACTHTGTHGRAQTHIHPHPRPGPLHTEHPLSWDNT